MSRTIDELRRELSRLEANADLYAMTKGRGAEMALQATYLRIGDVQRAIAEELDLRPGRRPTAGAAQ